MLKKGDKVKVRMAGTSDDWTPAEVILASHNGKSVMLALESLVRARGGFIGAVLPLIVDKTITGLDGTEYDILVEPPYSD